MGSRGVRLVGGVPNFQDDFTIGAWGNDKLFINLQTSSIMEMLQRD